MVFTNAHCPAPQCSGSRTAVLTGREPFRSGVYDNLHDYREAYPDLVNLPQHFMAGGYQAMNVGKMFHFPEPAAFHFNHHPTDLVDLRTLRDPEDGWGLPIPSRDEVFNWGPIEHEFERLHDGQVASWATEALATRCEPPFYLSVGIFMPHLPWFVPADFLGRFPPDEISLPSTYRSDRNDLSERAYGYTTTGRNARVQRTDQHKKVIACYLAAMAVADEALGRVLSALEASAFADDTIVVVWSDHGHHLGQKMHWSKYDLWDDTTHVPLVISAPGVTRAGGCCPAPVSLISLFPTLVNLCDLPPMAGLDGASLEPLLVNPAAEWRRPAIITSKYSLAVRSARYRYIRYDSGDEELYDHESDPNEWVNLESVSGGFKDLKAELAGWLPKTTAPPVPALSPREAQRRARTVPTTP